MLYVFLHLIRLVASTEQRQKIQENIDDIHIKHHGGKHIIFRTDLVFLASHYQLSVERQELERRVQVIINKLIITIYKHILCIVCTSFVSVLKVNFLCLLLSFFMRKSLCRKVYIRR